MTNNTFCLAAHYLHHRNAVILMIEKYKGMYRMNGTAQGEVYRVQFDDPQQSDDFRKELRGLIRGVYGY